MANKYYSVGLINTINDIKSALSDKYGVSLTVHYNTASYLVFSCPAIADKVIKIQWGSSRFIIYYGDEWETNETITNQVGFAGYGAGLASEIHLVLGDTFLLFNYLASALNSVLAIIAKMTSDDYICIGFMGSSNSNYNAGSRGINTTKSRDISFITLGGGFQSGNGKLYKQEMIIRGNNGEVEETGGGNIATIAGIYNISYPLGVNMILKSASFLITSSSMYMSGVVPQLNTSLFVEF